MNRETEIVANKQLRKDIDEIVQRVKELPLVSAALPLPNSKRV